MSGDLADNLPTYLTPPDRDPLEQLYRSVERIRRAPGLQAIMDAIPHVVLVVNSKRQVIFANSAMQSLLCSSSAELLGKRPGEAFHCIHSTSGPDGCGSSQHCTACQVLTAILECQQSGSVVGREALLSVDDSSGSRALELRVTMAPVDLEGEHCLVCSLEDISEQKRLAVLSRIFFHDVLGVAGCVHGCVQSLSDGGTTQQDKGLVKSLVRMTSQLVEEIRSQRDLMDAESGDLEVRPMRVSIVHLLEDLRTLYSGHVVAENRHIRLADVWNGQLVTDGRLLSRVLGNMLKNALEATAPGGTVTLTCAEAGDHVVFSVHNAAVMPREVQLQVFQRSFSTKGESGRGIGTHSIRLIGERYLNGKVDFSSHKPVGTTFTVTLPKDLPEAAGVE